jgi:hypothetical protein
MKPEPLKPKHTIGGSSGTPHPSYVNKIIWLGWFYMPPLPRDRKFGLASVRERCMFALVLFVEFDRDRDRRSLFMYLQRRL